MRTVLERFEAELGFIVIQTRREFEMSKQWRNWRRTDPILLQAVEKSESLDRHLRDSIREMRATRSVVPAEDQQIPTALLQSPFIQEEKPKMSAPVTGSFSASIKAMMDEARAGVAQARADGMATVKDAVGKLHEAKVATATVSSSMAKTIQDEAAAVMAELGQISNDLTGEA